MLAQNTPDLIVANVSQGLRQQRTGPLPIAFRRRFVQQRQHPFLRRLVVMRWPAIAVCVPQPVQPPFAEALPPLRRAGGPGLQLRGDLQVGLSLMSQEDHLRPLYHPMFTRTSACPLPEDL